MYISITKDNIDHKNFNLVFSGNNYGAVACFNGFVRNNEAHTIKAIEIEHHPILTLPSLEQIANNAIHRFNIVDCSICHRVGLILLNELIVNISVASMHRQEAFDACQYIMDYLKNEALFWKKEYFTDTSYSYVDIKNSDIAKKKLWN